MPWRGLVVLLAVFCTQVPWVRPTNFAGFDEWTITGLAARGIVDIPYANRPLGLLTAIPVALLEPYSFAAYAHFYGAYFFLSAVTLYLLGRRLAPARPGLCLLTACVFLVWCPSDLARLSAVDRAVYGGIAFGMLVAASLFVESWARGSEVLLALAGLAAFAIARCYEATVPFLVAAPLLLVPLRPQRGRRLWAWIGAWEVLLGLATLLVLQPVLFPDSAYLYQSDIGVVSSPPTLLARLFTQYRLHLLPLVTVSPSDLRVIAVPIAVVVFVVGWIAIGRTEREQEQGSSRRFYFGAMATGLLFAGLGYSLFIVAARISDQIAWRTEFLSSPGIALFLASGALLAATSVRGQARSLVAGALASWVVAVGTGATVALQERFDRSSLYAPQIGMLSRLVAIAPDLQPHTLVIVIDEIHAWRTSFGFRHALEYLYQGRAAGHVVGAVEGMFPVSFGADGVRSDPWPEVRAAWGEPRTVYRYDELAVVRLSASRGLALEEEWPRELPALPPGARYAPAARVVWGAQPPPERAILAPLPTR